MKGILKGIGIGLGVYGVALAFSLGVVYGVKAQERVAEDRETDGDRVLFASIDNLDKSVEQLRSTFE